MLTISYVILQFRGYYLESLTRLGSTVSKGYAYSLEFDCWAERIQQLGP